MQAKNRPQLASLLALFKQRQMFPVSGRFHLLHRDEAQGRRINAVAEAGGGRAVRKNMTEMGVSLLTAYFRAAHAMTQVAFLLQGILPQRFGKTGPATAGIKFVQ